ncbi:enolase C-terminal domain-like protein [Hymenobacter sp. BT491]|uniref:enolase C-terminal domain-like protein n=1 Tax=Hymenobacter sp. BT491 TaxID=2766779 RepID=UPI001653514E|nr:enolase C-terminal domain-like protein [Hymenobacter sp. BT491]MBC6992351.1 hypothetical protein [Hymenobacter sp. BT491]
MVSRRHFVKLAGAVPVWAGTHFAAAEALASPATAREKHPTVRSITLFTGTGTFARFVGMNAYDTAPKGITATTPLVKIVLSDGTVGVGPRGYGQTTQELLRKVKSLLGQDPGALYTWDKNRITGVAASPFHDWFFDPEYAWLEAPLLDALGKLRQVPVWQLFGPSVRDGMDAYDGTLYFEEIANKTSVSILAELGKRSKNDGYRAIKMKLGRPYKWLPGEAGLNRDIEALATLREAVGNNHLLMADANNGYQNHFDWAVKLMKAGAQHNLFFMEELFPENPAQYAKLREVLLQANMFLPIATGEGIRDLRRFDQHCRDGVYHYIQPDMATSGLSNIVYTAQKAAAFPHVKLIPHVWQNQLGLIMSLHASKIQANIPFVEDSRYFEHSLLTSGYTFTQGQWFIPNKPGWGVELAPDYQQYVVGPEVVLV